MPPMRHPQPARYNETSRSLGGDPCPTHRSPHRSDSTGGADMAESQIPDGSIIITPKEFYDGVRSDIADIKSAVSPLPGLATRVDKNEERLTKLERLAWLALG